MTVRQALGRGLRALVGLRRMCVVFYAVLTAAALLAAGPVMMVAIHSLGSSTWASEMRANLNVQWIGELIAERGALPVLQVLPLMAGVFAIGLMADLFLLGGALQLMAGRQPFSLGAFFAGCGRNFAVLIRLGLVSLLFYGAAALAWFGLSSLGDSIWGEGSAATPLVHWSWFAAAATACLFGAVNLIFDYARIHAVGRSAGSWQSTKAALRFVWAHGGRASGLYAAVWLLVLAGIAVYLAATGLLSAPVGMVVLVLFVVRQCAVFGKVWLRLLFYSAQGELYAAWAAKEEAPAVEAPTPADAVLPLGLS